MPTKRKVRKGTMTKKNRDEPLRSTDVRCEQPRNFQRRVALSDLVILDICFSEHGGSVKDLHTMGLLISSWMSVSHALNRQPGLASFLASTWMLLYKITFEDRNSVQ